MKKLSNQLLRFGALTLICGAFTAANADPQAEKGDAGPLKMDAEVFDCKKDKWFGNHISSDDCDLICLWWGGGPFSIKCIPTSGALDCAIAVFRDNGTCYAAENSGGVGVTETLMIPNLPPGICYIYTGYYKWNMASSKTDYDGMSYYCDYMSVIPPGGITSPSGTFYGCRIPAEATPGWAWEVCFQEGLGWQHAGVPFQQAAKAGEKSGKTKGGKTTKIMSSRKKAKFFCSCDNPTDKRGATGVSMRGVSKKKFKQKYIDIADGSNLTAELTTFQFCKNYDPGAKQIFKCVMKPKGRFKKMNNVKGKCIEDCIHNGGVTADSQKVNFYASLAKSRKKF